VPQQNGVVERKNRTLVEMARTMLDEHRTPRCFWTDAISTVCYISNRIFLRKILYLTPFELHFGRKPSISHLRPFDCMCFVLKYGNLDKFESHFLIAFCLDILIMADLIECLTLRLISLLSLYDVIFDETASCPYDVFECAGDKEMEESIFINEELQSFDCDKDKSLLPSTSSPELAPSFTP
jgi:hypothetical protein